MRLADHDKFQDLTVSDLWYLVHRETLAGIPLFLPGKGTWFVNSLDEKCLPELEDELFSESMCSMAEGAAFPIDFFWLIITVITVSGLPLLLSTLGVFVLSMLSGKIFYSGTRSETSLRIGKLQKELNFVQAKLAIADHLLGQFCQQLGEPQPQLGNNVIIYNPPHLSVLRNTIGVSFGVSSVMFSTYYLSSMVLLDVWAASSTVAGITGPVGMGLALAISVMLGLYLGYRHYQFQKKCQNIGEQIAGCETALHLKQVELCNLVDRHPHLIEPNLQSQTFKVKGYSRPVPTKLLTALPSSLWADSSPRVFGDTSSLGMSSYNDNLDASLSA